MSEIDGIVNAPGLFASDKALVQSLVDVLNAHLAHNVVKRTYYDGTATVKSIGLNVIPDMARVDVSCDWPRKAVSSLAERSQFDGFVFEDGEQETLLNRVSRDCRISTRYRRNLNSELVHGCMGATVGKNYGRPFVRFHSAEQCAMIWDVASERLSSGLCIADAARTKWSPDIAVPTSVHVHTPGRILAFTRSDSINWSVESYSTGVDVPMMVAFAHAATGDKPLGTSRITKTVRDLTDEAMRVLEYMAVSGALNAAPQKYLLGLDKDNFEAFMSNKDAMYIGSWVVASADEDGNKPTIGQLSGSNAQPYIDELRALASLFSAATGVPLNSLGIVQDNPSSAEAIDAAREDIAILADNLNEDNGESLRDVALLAMAVANNCGIGELPEESLGAMAHFMPTTRSTKAESADAALKLAQAVDGFANTPEFWEMYGLNERETRRTMSDLDRTTATQQLEAISQALGGRNE